MRLTAGSFFPVARRHRLGALANGTGHLDKQHQISGGHLWKSEPNLPDPKVKLPLDLDNSQMQFLTTIPLSLQAVLLLIASNVFMIFAWYGHLKNLATAPWYVAALVSWGIALFEYLLQVPANRIGFQQAGFSVAQLKIVQEVITLAVFVPFAVIYLNQPLKLDYVWAGLCLIGAVYFIFRSA